MREEGGDRNKGGGGGSAGVGVGTEMREMGERILIDYFAGKGIK